MTDMNEKADKPEDEAPGSSQPEETKRLLREIPDEELVTILEEHKKWLGTGGKEGEKADFLCGDLGGRNFYGLNLREVNFDFANLEKATFQTADLSRASFQRSFLKEVYLYGANLQRADLYMANLQGAKFSGAKLHNARLIGADLRDSDLSLIDGLNKAKICHCNLEGATGLRGTEFARADITGAKLPEDIRDFKILKIVEETSKNARKIFLAMLLGCVYSWLTIATTTDVNLLTNSSSSPLPIIRTAIPIAWFYLTAPFLLVGFYLYLHFYLHRLWEGLAGLPARFEDGKRLDQRAYPWLLNGLVRRHFDEIKKKRSLIARLEEWVSIILAWWVVPFTMCCFWLRYIPRHDWWPGTVLHIGLIILSIAAGIIFYRSHVRTLRGVEPGKYRLKKAWRDRRTFQFLAVILIGFVLIVLSNGSIKGTRYEGIPRIFRWFGYDVFANFREKDVSTRPDNYWLIDSEDRANSVIGADLFEADLRQADAKNAFMAKADLRNARLQGAVLWKANLKGAYLFKANLKGANLWRAHLEGTDLSWAHLEGADFGFANLEGADLDWSYLKGADLTDATGLTQEQLDKACGDSLTILPPGLTIRDCPTWR